VAFVVVFLRSYFSFSVEEDMLTKLI
jgi:hypothetical protein